MKHSGATLGNTIKMTFVVTLPLVGFVAAIVLFWNTYVFASDIALFAVFFFFSMLGITVGFHRMLTHQGFGAPVWLRAFFLICGCMSFEGPPDVWTAIHIRHHAHSDEEDDPHSPLQGFWHAHIGWLFEYYGHPENYKDLLPTDPVTRFVSRTYVLWAALGLAIPFALGGWTGLVWGGLLRVFLNTHITYSVNSVCHMFGRRMFETTDESHNHWVVGLLAFGEGWHNNHHAFPRNAFHGMRWWQFDLSGLIIRGLEAIGLAWDVQRVAPEMEEAHRTRAQAMYQAINELRLNVMNSVRSSRAEISALGARFVAASMTDAQRSQCHQMQIYAMQRLDAMHDAILQSAHLKRQKLEKYQREAHLLLADCKQKLSLLVGERVSA